MAKHLSKREVRAIVAMIGGWDSAKITWTSICNRCEKLIGRIPTRQALYANSNIKDAYIQKKAALTDNEDDRVLPSSLKRAARQILSLQRKVDLLERENQMLLERFVRWQYNSYKNGMTESQLNEPLPAIDRDRTE